MMLSDNLFFPARISSDAVQTILNVVNHLLPPLVSVYQMRPALDGDWHTKFLFFSQDMKIPGRQLPLLDRLLIITPPVKFLYFLSPIYRQMCAEEEPVEKILSLAFQAGGESVTHCTATNKRART
jgi:hypothetical protein